MEKSPSKERWSFPRLGEIPPSPTLIIKMSRINQGKGAFSFFLRQNWSFFLPFFSKTAQQGSPPAWPSTMAMQGLTSEPIIPHKHRCPQPHPWEKHGSKRPMSPRLLWGPREKGAAPTQSGSGTISHSPWMKLRDVLGGKAGLGSCRRACPRLSPLVTSGGDRAICQKPTVTSETLLIPHSPKNCSHRRLSKQKGMNQDAPSGKSPAWNAQAIPYAEAQICPLAEWQGQKWTEIKKTGWPAWPLQLSPPWGQWMEVSIATPNSLAYHNIFITSQSI